MNEQQFERVTDSLLGRITALELLVAGLLNTATHRQREVATQYLELAYSGGLASQDVTEAFLHGFEATRNKILGMNPEAK